MKTVAILSDFYDADPTYSLNIVIEGQLSMLSRAGYAPIAFAEADKLLGIVRGEGR